MKRFVSLLLCAVLVLGMLPALPAVAEETALPDDSVVYINPEADTAVTPAPELPIEPIRDPWEGIGTNDISQSGSSYYFFTTFQDLKELAAGSYEDYSYAHYDGEGDLVISESITLPANLFLYCDSLVVPVGVTLSTETFVSTDYTVINGTLVLNTCFLHARKLLTINGTVRVPGFGGVSILSTTDFSGRENIIGEQYIINYLYDGISSIEELENVLAEVEGRADPFFNYQINLTTSDLSTPFTLSKSLVVPENVILDTQEYPMILSSGCTLTINGGAFFNDITINGILQNNNYVRFYGSASFRSDASYSGTGYLYVHPETIGLTHEDVVTGLDFSRFELRIDSSVDGDNTYVLRCLPQLDTPTDLQWGIYHYQNGEVIHLPAAISWRSVSTGESETCAYAVNIYKKGEDTPVITTGLRCLVECEWEGMEAPFSDANPESGTYYFTVQALGNDTHRSSEVAVSPEWVYVNPNNKLPVATNLRWNWPNPEWDEPAGANQSDRVMVNYYFSRTPEEEPIFLEGYGDAFVSFEGGHAPYIITKEKFEKNGAGYYYFTVRYCSEDITVATSGDESALSPGYYYDPADHTYVAQTPVAPTCTEQGYTTYKCAICGDSYDGDFTPATGHNWTNATCTAPKTCSVCGQTEGNALGHSWKDATCTAPKTCSVCGQTEGSALGHSYSDGSCTRCGAADPGYVPPAVEGSVTRLAGAGRVETSLAIADALKAQLGVTKFRNVLVASALNFPDALAGSYLAAKVDAPILLTYAGAQAQVMAYIHGNLQPGGTVYILGGESAVSADFVNMLSASGVNCVRVAGTDRFATNLAILEKAGVSAGQPILVCTATGFADSLSVSATGLPILLVGKSLSPAQKDFLNRCGGGKLWIIGGTGAVSPSIEEELRQYSSQIQRLAGAGRHETSVLVAETFFQEADSAVIAYSMNFPDGLCGGPLAYALGAPLILTTSTDTCVNVFTDPRNIVSGFVLGGNTLVSDSAVRRIFHQSQ